MISKSSSRAFTLIEVIVAVAVLATAMVFVTRSFTSVMASTRLCQDISRACFLADGLMWRAQRAQADSVIPLDKRESTTGKYSVIIESKSGGENTSSYGSLVLTHARLSWKVQGKEAVYPLDLFTYFFRKK